MHFDKVTLSLIKEPGILLQIDMKGRANDEATGFDDGRHQQGVSRG